MRASRSTRGARLSLARGETMLKEKHDGLLGCNYKSFKILEEIARLALKNLTHFTV